MAPGGINAMASSSDIASPLSTIPTLCEHSSIDSNKQMLGWDRFDDLTVDPTKGT